MKGTNWWLVGALGVGAYLLFKKSQAAAVPVVAQPAAPAGAGPAALIMQTAFEPGLAAAAAATNYYSPTNAKTQCEMAGMYWAGDHCVDPMTDRTACTALGGTWAGGTCTFPDTTGM